MAQTDLRFTFESAGAAGGGSHSHTSFDVVEFKLVEGLSECYRLEVELLSSNPAIDFGAILDQGATFTIWQGGTAVRQVHGLVSEFFQGNTGFRRTRYRAVVEPQLARAQLTSDWRIFQQQTSPAILEEIFKANHIMGYSLNAQAEHLQREYCVQAGDTDFDFIARLAAEEGFVYRFDHSQGNHQLLLTDAVQSYGAIPEQQSQQDGEQEDNQSAQQAGPVTYRPVLYQPNPGGDCPQPALRTFTYQEQVRTSRQTQRDYTFKNPPYAQQHSHFGQNLNHQSQHYERYDYPGRYKQDAAGQPFTQTRIQSLRRDARIAIAQGDDARLEPGLAFQLTGHAREDMNILWRPIHIEHSGTQHTAGEEEAATAQQSTSYEQKAVLVPATADWKAPILPKPLITGPLMAHVSGPEGEELFTDEYGRVKVQFPWDRQGGNDQHSSCWIRVAQNWAGAGWGHMAIPRIGQEVIVDFLDGDPDQPIVNGRTYDAQHPVPYKLPALKTQMTIKSKEHKGAGFNELLIDDTTGEIKTQLHSTYGTTQLTLGYLTHPRNLDGTGEERGHGFELRTDEWGAIRAAKGLYISTDARHEAEGKQLDLQEAIEQLNQAVSITTSLRNAAEVARAELADLQRQKELLMSTMQELKQAGLLLSSPEGVAVTSPKAVQAHAGENLFFTSGKQIDASSINNLTLNAGDTLSMLAVNKGAKLIAMNGEMNIEAHQDRMNLTSVKDMTIMSTQGKTEVTAKDELLLTCGGSYIRLKAGLIEIGSAGTVKVRSANFDVTGPNTVTTSGPGFEGAYQEFFILRDKTTGLPLPYAHYEITTEDGQVFKGRADRDGKTITYHTPTPQDIIVKILG